jgi:hypothetical protein
MGNTRSTKDAQIAVAGWLGEYILYGGTKQFWVLSMRLPHVTFLASRNLRCLKDMWKIYSSCLEKKKTYDLLQSDSTRLLQQCKPQRNKALSTSDALRRLERLQRVLRPWLAIGELSSFRIPSHDTSISSSKASSPHECDVCSHSSS